MGRVRRREGKLNVVLSENLRLKLLFGSGLICLLEGLRDQGAGAFGYLGDVEETGASIGCNGLDRRKVGAKPR